VSSSVRRSTFPGLVCAALSIATPAAGAQPASPVFGACQPTQVVFAAAGLQCATLDVPFDRANPAAGRIALAVQRVPPSAPRTGAIVLLAGGPGQPALPAFEALLAPLAREPALAGFELVAFDQRGTGQSEALQCPEPGGLFTGSSSTFLKQLESYFTECGNALGATRTLYTSQESVEDLHSLRDALAGPKLSLLAVSYGGRVAGMFAREHPHDVARMVLDSPSPLSGSDPLDSQRLRALRRVLDEGICGAGACRSISGDVYADLTRVVAALRRHPLHSRLYNSNGRLTSAHVTQREVLRLLLSLDLSQGVRELAPAAIAAAARGDSAPLARVTRAAREEAIAGGYTPPEELTRSTAARLPEGLVEQPLAAHAPESDSAISFTLFAATYCIENELPWSPASPVAGRRAALRSWLAALPPATTAPFAPAVVVGSTPIAVCEEWPPTSPAPASPAGVSATPTLIMSGADDLRTPYEQDLVVAAGYSDARLLRVADVGHSTVTSDRTGCAKRAIIQFLTTGTAPVACPGSGEPQALPLPPSSLHKIPPAASRSRLAGRVAAAAAITLEDVLAQPGRSGGGLRGGYWQPQGNGAYVLHGVIDVPGVALSGTVEKTADLTGRFEITGHVKVRGRLSGSLKLAGCSLSGVVGGARVDVGLAAL
jgi:pimeloyl-ACP methyl ester carboxylesterase